MRSSNEVESRMWTEGNEGHEVKKIRIDILVFTLGFLDRKVQSSIHSGEENARKFCHRLTQSHTDKCKTGRYRQRGLLTVFHEICSSLSVCFCVHPWLDSFEFQVRARDESVWNFGELGQVQALADPKKQGTWPSLPTWSSFFWTSMRSSNEGESRLWTEGHEDHEGKKIRINILVFTLGFVDRKVQISIRSGEGNVKMFWTCPWNVGAGKSE